LRQSITSKQVSLSPYFLPKGKKSRFVLDQSISIGRENHNDLHPLRQEITQAASSKDGRY